MLFTFSNSNKTVVKALDEGYMVIAKTKEPIRKGRVAWGVRLDIFDPERARTDVDVGVASMNYQWTMDWLRNGNTTTASASWFVRQEKLEKDDVIICEVDYGKNRIRIGARNRAVLFEGTFDPALHAPLWPCWACRPAGFQVTLVPARPSELDSLPVA